MDSGDAIRRDDYITKLSALMNQLEMDSTPPAAAVQSFWAQLSQDERHRFSSEFPQFMCYVDQGPSPDFALGAPPTSTSIAVPIPSATTSTGQNLLVHGVPSTVTAKDLAGVFSQYGQLLGITVMKPPGNTDAATPNIAQVNFAQALDADRAARATNGAVLAGESIRVAPAASEPPPVAPS